MSQLLGLLPGCALGQVDARNWEAALRIVAEHLLGAGYVKPSFVPAIVSREEHYPTGLPTDVACALPHTDPEHVVTPGLAVAALAHPVSFASMSNPQEYVDARLIVMLCVAEPSQQVKTLTRVLERLQDTAAVESMLAQQAQPGFESEVKRWLGAPTTE